MKAINKIKVLRPNPNPQDESELLERNRIINLDFEGITYCIFMLLFENYIYHNMEINKDKKSYLESYFKEDFNKSDFLKNLKENQRYFIGTAPKKDLNLFDILEYTVHNTITDEYHSEMDHIHPVLKRIIENTMDLLKDQIEFVDSLKQTDMSPQYDDNNKDIECYRRHGIDTVLYEKYNGKPYK